MNLSSQPAFLFDRTASQPLCLSWEVKRAGTALEGAGSNFVQHLYLQGREYAMTLQEILNAKGSKVLSIAPESTLADVVQQLVKFNCGSLVVCEREDCAHMVGIVTERDILRACAAGRASLDKITIAEVMSRKLVTGMPNDSLQHAMGVMTQHRIRHLPIVAEDNKLVGIVSIGDLVKHQHDQLSMENHYLKTYIQS